MSVEIKGGTIPLCATNIWICSNLTIRQWYPDLDELTVAALERRIEVLEMNELFSTYLFKVVDQY